jgi:hypothetical protein
MINAVGQEVTDELASLELVLPDSDEFWVYGGEGIVARAKDWAGESNYALVQGVARCAHGLYGLCSCCTCKTDGALDHANMWVPADLSDHPFILSAPYSRLGAQGRAYAGAHGVSVEESPWHDWYGSGTYPITWTFSDHVHWTPLEFAIARWIDAHPRSANQ